MFLNFLLYLFFGVLTFNAGILFILVFVEFIKYTVRFFKSLYKRDKHNIARHYGSMMMFLLCSIFMLFAIGAFVTPMINKFQ